MKINNFLYLQLFLLSIMVSSCKKMVDPAFNKSDYPEEIAKIIDNKCATAGCHNDNSFQNAANLNLTTWDDLLAGGVNGSVVVAFSPAQSSLMQFVNTYEDIGLITAPTMPINRPVLSRDEVLTIKKWITNGCPSRDGKIPYAENYANRSKVYITNQGCDLVSIVDAESKLVMRYVKVGHDPNQIEVPHCVRVSSDGKYWYTCFTNGAYFQKYSAATDSLVAELNIGQGSWNILKISPDDSKAYLSDFVNNGKLIEVDLNTMTIKKTLAGSGLFAFPHGLAYTQTADTIYATAQYGNMIYRIIPSIPQVDKISIQKNALPVTTPQLLDPHEILMSADYSKYFLTCQASNELRVMDARADTLLHVIPMGIYPLEFVLSKKRNLLFVVNQEDVNPVYPSFRGSVYVVDLNTMKVVQKIYEKFFQPHGLALEEKRGLLFVASRNADPTGPAPHHLSECNGRNSFFHVIDINTWKAIKPANELSVDAYSMDIRE